MTRKYSAFSKYLTNANSDAPHNGNHQATVFVIRFEHHTYWTHYLHKVLWQINTHLDTNLGIVERTKYIHILLLTDVQVSDPGKRPSNRQHNSGSTTTSTDV